MNKQLSALRGDTILGTDVHAILSRRVPRALLGGLVFAMATTAICTTLKAEVLQAVHNFLATTTQTASGVSAAFTLTGMASTANIAVGMAATGTNVAAGAVVSSIDSATQVTLSKAHTGTITTLTITFTADAFKLLLIKSSPVRTFDGTQTNVGTPGTAAASATNVGTDEASGTGYTTGGLALTNVTPVSTNPTTSAAASFSGTIQWTGATISTVAAVIYNNSVRQGSANGITANASGSAIGRSVSVHDFGGTQSVTAGTLTLTVPTQDGTTGLIRIT